MSDEYITPTSEQLIVLAKAYMAMVSPYVHPVVGAQLNQENEILDFGWGSCVIIEVDPMHFFLVSAGHVLKNAKKGMMLEWWQGHDLTPGLSPIRSRKFENVIFHRDEKGKRRSRRSAGGRHTRLGDAVNTEVVFSLQTKV